MTHKEFCEIMDNSNFMIDSNNPYDIKILEALEKQIPKKPKPHEDDEYSAKCPNCYDEVDTHWVHGGISYCPNCGQALDWSDAK